MFRKPILLFLTSLPFLLQAQFYEPNYGIIINMNYTTVGARYDDLSGRGMGSFGMYYQRPLSPYHSNNFFNSFDYSLEPAYTLLGYHDQVDKRFNGTYVDFSACLNYI